MPKLPYELNGLEPVISAKLLDFHYNKHHKAYVDNLNAKTQEADDALKAGDIRKLVSLTQAIKFHGGGHYNHNFFWESLAPPKEGGGHRPEKGSELNELLTKHWGTIDKFIEEFNSKTILIQGSGWGWLVYNKTTKALEYRETYNQDIIKDQNPSLHPLLNIDIWEHAFYIDYKNAKGDFLKKIWDVVNW